MTSYHMTGSGTVYVTDPSEGIPRGCHAVAVLSPEDRQQVERLAELVWDAEASAHPGVVSGCGSGSCYIDAMQQALRAMLAPPKPPKPEEPLGLGAVVVDSDGDQWTRYRVDLPGYLGVIWGNARTSQSLRYSRIDAVEVLSQGVTS